MDTQKLKDKILQLAIQGKLVEQDSNDEPASELLKKIETEKKKLYKEGEIKKPKKLSPIKDAEKPFEIPESWEWVRFNDINKIITCGHASTPKYVEKGMPFISAKNVKPYKFMPKDHKFISYELYEKLTKKNKPEINDILMTRVGAGIGESAIIDVDFDFAIYVSLTLIKPFHEHVTSRYILHWLNSPEGVKKSIENIYGKGSSQGNLNVGNVRAYVLPIPPVEEQKRIVEKIDELFELIDILDSDKEKLLETIELTRNKVLQDAIQGKLVEQDPNDEPASELLKKIEAEKKKLYKEGKIKKPKKLPPIKEEEKPFDIPESWEWVKLGDICYKLTDGSHNPPKGIDGKGYPMISAVNINEKIDFSKPSRIISKKNFEKEHKRTNISKNDILLTTVGTIGRSVVVETNELFTVQRSVAVINTGLYPYYVRLFFISSFFYNQMINNAKGTAQLGIYLGKLSNLIICCPPLNEQKRIFEKIDNIFNYCDLLEELVSD